MVAMGCEVHGFDPSIGKKSGKWGERHFFHQMGVGGEDKTYAPGKLPYAWPGGSKLDRRTRNKEKKTKTPWTLRTIPTIMKLLSHTKVAVLKFDVEGFEWYLLEQILTDKSFVKRICSGELVIDQIVTRLPPSPRARTHYVSACRSS